MTRRGRFRLVAMAVAAGLSLSATVYWALPWAVEPCEPPAAPATAVTDRHGEWLGLLPQADFYRWEQLPCSAERLPDKLVQALLAAEDKRFFRHGGVDALAALRALWGRVAGKSGSGASTLTMQLVKLANGRAAVAAGRSLPPRNMESKLRECLQARRMEMQHGKAWILHRYLENADFGNLCRGAEAAARFYFGKSVAELDTPQAALLAAVVQAPTRLDPLRHPQAALARRNRILAAMGEAADAPLGVAEHDVSVPAYLAPQAGRLTLDAGLQRECRAIARRELGRLKGRHVSQAAVVVLDNRSGEVLVRIGAAFPESPLGGKMDGTATPRSAGSTLKPFVYALAFTHGAWPGTVLADVPTLYRAADGIQAPGNYLHHYLGPISIRKALACSQNVPAMEALNACCGGNGGMDGVEGLLELLHKLGYAVEGDARAYGLGLAIGNAHVTLLEQVRAFATLARGGTLPPLRLMLPKPGETPPESPRVLDEAVCYQISDILSDASARAEGFGNAHGLRFPFRCACKTGTSSNFRDNWCIGYTAEYTVGVWCGNFDNSPMLKVSGVSGAGPIFHAVFQLLADRGKQHFPPRPEGIREVETDTRTGLLPTETTPAACRRKEIGTDANIPTTSGRYDAQGHALLDSRYAEWFRDKGDKHLFALDAAAPSPRKADILIPADGSVVHIDPLLPDGGRRILLRSTLPESVAEWSCDTLSVYRQNGRWYADLTPGEHILRVHNPATGQSAHATFVIKNDE